MGSGLVPQPLFGDTATMLQSLGFARAFVRDRQHIGACLPSSKALAQAMVRALGPVPEGQVILELGPGTGVFTRALHTAWPQRRLVAVEFMSDFAHKLRLRFPDADVVHGCASALPQHLADCDLQPQQVAGVVSGLPLLSLPEEMREGIFASIRSVLEPGRPYVQFTYAKRSWNKFMPQGLRLQSSRRVWRNVPPATVLTFVRDDSPATG